MTSPPPTGAVRNSSALGIGALVGGALAYVFFALATRALGAADAAPVAVLWAWWGFAGAGLTFPLQHWISRSATVHGGEGAVRSAIPAVTLLVLGVSAAVGIVSWLARDALFGRDDAIFPLLVAAVTAGSGMMGLVRGTLTARRRFVSVGGSLVAENGLRCVAVGILFASGSTSPAAYGACLVAGYVAATLLWPDALRVRDTGARLATDRPFAFLTGASVGQVLSQAVLTGGPVLLAAASGAPAEVTALFAGLALFRAPYVIALGLVTQLTERLTRLVTTGQAAKLRGITLGVLVATLVTSALAAPLGGQLGPPLMELVFGEGVRLESGPAGTVAVGSVLALANLVLTIAVLAHNWPRLVVATWLGALVPGYLGFVLGGFGSTLEATCVAFVVTEGFAFLGLSAASLALPRGQKDRRPER